MGARPTNKIRLGIFYIFLIFNKSYEKTVSYNVIVISQYFLISLPSLWLSAPSPLGPNENTGHTVFLKTAGHRSFLENITQTGGT